MPFAEGHTTHFSWRKSFELARNFFLNSNDKSIAQLMLALLILCVIGSVALMTIFSWWFAGFWAALTAKALAPFLMCMAKFVLIAGAYIGISVLKNYLINKLSILWRDWLTKKTIDKVFENENNYLDLKRFSAEMDNIAQRIQQDIERYVSLTLSLSMDFLNATLTLGAFVSTLWIISGPLNIVLFGMNLFIPGYLVWAALIVSFFATITTHYIGKSLPR